MERVLNIFHYCIYLFFNKFHLFNNNINPVFLLYKLPYFRNKHKKKGFDPVKVQNELWMNKENGVNIWISDGVLSAIFSIIFLSLFFIITNTFDIPNNIPKPYFFIFVVIGLYISYVYVFKKNRYLVYYEEFENWTKKQRKKNMLFSFLVIIGTIALFFASLLVSF